MSITDSAPVWLREEPDLVALLNAALDRFDRQPAQERERDVFLSAERFLPSLSHSDAAADQLWALVGELERLKVLKIRRRRPGPYDPEWKGARLAFPAGELSASAFASASSPGGSGSPGRSAPAGSGVTSISLACRF